MSTQTATEHANRLYAKSVRTDSLVVGPAGTDFGAHWTTTTASLAGGALGTGPSNEVRYVIVGKTCICNMLIGQTGAGTASGTLTLSLPVTARSNLFVTGVGILNTTTGAYQITALGDSASTIVLYATINTSGPELISNASTAGTRLTQTVWTLVLQVTYEIA